MADMLKQYQAAGKTLMDKLHFSTYPLAVRYIKNQSEIPAGAFQPSAFGQKLALCQAFTQARRFGMTMAMTADDNFCTPSTAAHSWVDISVDDLMESQVQQGWHKDKAAEKRRFEKQGEAMLSNMVNDPSEYCGLLCAPLFHAPFEPHTVLVYCDGEQITHLIHALSYEYLHVPESLFDGFAEACMKGGLIPFVTGRPQVVIPGAGDRSFSGTQTHELAIGMPGELVFYVLENLFKTGGEMNPGYPSKIMLPTHLTEEITPGFAFMREKIDNAGKSGDKSKSRKTSET
ncbi:MAG: DUF169 domain-containing protein [Thermodesulfobacteriota bacterium]|nr:DUF169 domain-containing protein [Thermodesulfobacteriota bacterium]